MNRIFYGLFLVILLHQACQSKENKEDKVQKLPKQETYHPQFDLTFLTGKFDFKNHGEFIEIDKAFADVAGRYMLKEAYEAFVNMANAAQKEGVELKIISATRNFDYQKGIWERKWTGQTTIEGSKKANEAYIDEVARAKAILRYSAMPSASRHHWGTDIDLNALNNRYFEHGYGLTVFQWLEKNADDFGFGRPYTSKEEGRTGYEEEKWHWSYLPLSKIMTKDIEVQLNDDMIRGFQGDHTAPIIGIKKNYILGIHHSCF